MWVGALYEADPFSLVMVLCVTIMQRNSEVCVAYPMRSFQSWTISRRCEAIVGFMLICTQSLVWKYKYSQFELWLVGMTGVILVSWAGGSSWTRVCYKAEGGELRKVLRVQKALTTASHTAFS